MDLLLRMKKTKEKAVKKRKEFLSYYYLHKFDQEYDRSIELAREAPSRKPLGKAGAEEKREVSGIVRMTCEMQGIGLPFYP